MVQSLVLSKTMVCFDQTAVQSAQGLKAIHSQCCLLSTLIGSARLVTFCFRFCNGEEQVLIVSCEDGKYCPYIKPHFTGLEQGYCN